MVKKALVVRIDMYGGANRLFDCVNDANYMNALLRTNADGSPNFSVVIKNDIQGKAELNRAIRELFTNEVSKIYVR